MISELVSGISPFKYRSHNRRSKTIICFEDFNQKSFNISMVVTHVIAFCSNVLKSLVWSHYRVKNYFFSQNHLDTFETLDNVSIFCEVFLQNSLMWLLQFSLLPIVSPIIFCSLLLFTKFLKKTFRSLYTFRETLNDIPRHY